MAIDWGQVGVEALNAAKNVIGAQFANVAKPAAQQIDELTSIGADIEARHAAGEMTQEKYDMLRTMAKNALEGVLAADQAIATVVVEQAVAAAWAVVEKALGTLAGFAFV
jgi:hemoglobin-like flavoprotein